MPRASSQGNSLNVSTSLSEIALENGPEWTLFVEQPDHALYKGDIEEALGQASEITVELLALPAPDSLELVLLCTDTFRDSLPVQPWNDALHHEGRIFLRTPCKRPVAGKKLAPRIRHEYVHAALYAAGTSTIPLWLNEGLAFCIEYNRDAQGAVDLRKAIQKAGPPQVNWLQNVPGSSESILRPLAWNTLAQCAVQYLLEEHPALLQQYIQENRPDTIFPPQLMEPMVQACTKRFLAS